MHLRCPTYGQAPTTSTYQKGYLARTECLLPFFDADSHTHAPTPALLLPLLLES